MIDGQRAISGVGVSGDVGRDRLDEALELYRRELAQLHERQEEWMEQASLLPKAVAIRDAFAKALASRLSSEYWARQRPGRAMPKGMRGRLARWILEFGRVPNPEWSQIEAIEQSGYFDAAWYLVENPDVLAAGCSPASHYLRHGAAEGRDPGPNFSTDYYLRNDPEIAESGTNPLVHFERCGRNEGRLPSALAA